MAGEAAPNTQVSTEVAQPGTEVQQQFSDFAAVLRDTQGALGQANSTIEALRRDREADRQQFDRLRKAFSGEPEQKLTPTQQRIAKLKAFSAHLSHEVDEHRKAGGNGYPITAKIGQELVDFGLQATEENEALLARLAALEEQVKRTQNPEWQQIERAASTMEGMIQDNLEQLYPGDDKEMAGIRGAQFNAISARVHNEIKDLMKNDQEALQKVIRSPTVMRKMVNHFSAQILPPKLRAMLEEKREMDTPLTQEDLAQSFNEARQKWLEATRRENPNPAEIAHFSGLMDTLRREILANNIMGRKSRGESDQSSMASLMKTMVGGG